MIDKKLKIGTIVLGIFALFYSIYSLSAITMLLRLDGHFDIRMFAGNIIFTYLWLSPLSAIGLFVATFGLYKGRKWGYILSNICLILFLGGFVLVVIHHFFPDLIDSTVQLKSGWFVFYHMNLNLETLAVPSVVAILLVLLNLKFVRRAYH
jgi:hypothetical protein